MKKLLTNRAIPFCVIENIRHDALCTPMSKAEVCKKYKISNTDLREILQMHRPNFERIDNWLYDLRIKEAEERASIV